MSEPISFSANRGGAAYKLPKRGWRETEAAPAGAEHGGFPLTSEDNLSGDGASRFAGTPRVWPPQPVSGKEIGK